MRVSQVAKQLKVSPTTVRNLTRDGKLECTYNTVGQRTYTQEQVDAFLGKKTVSGTVFYVRSSSGDKALLQAQIDELTKKYGEPLKVYRDYTSGMSEHRPGLKALLRDASKGDFNRVCITYPDRLTRFGYTYLEALLAKDGVEIESVNAGVKYSLEEELMADFMSLITSFSGRFYRLRSKESKHRLLDKAKGEVDSS